MAETKNTKGAPVASEHNQQEALILKYKNLIIGVVCALIVCVGVGFFVKNCTTEQFNTASTDMAKAQEYFSRAIINGDSALFQKALNGDSINAGFVAAAEQGGKPGNLAKLYAGLCYAQLGQMQEAANYLEQFDGVGDEMISPAALGALGNVKAALGQLDEAVATLVKAAEKADNNTLSAQFLIQAGEILESQGKKEDALKLYEQIKAKYVNSSQYRNIDAYIERCK
jgi:tetratricopeptide (TPR) repeat protein